MAHESFEDEEVAELMNRAFVNIKVDREERPDIDNIYMSACQVMTGQGGWPLSIVMTPEGKPFYAGTYIPKDNKYGRMGMLEFVPEIERVWKDKRGDVLSAAEDITKEIGNFRSSEGDAEVDDAVFEEAIEGFRKTFDRGYGGFGRAPKFPSPHNLLFLLRYYRFNKDKEVLHMVKETLDAMRAGGIYDQIGGGFHRYSTDRKWLVPHFEKMLYDQALLIMAYTEGYEVTKNEIYKRTVEEIYEYAERDMLSSEGVFYSAEDADSEGVEGKFYTFSYDELEKFLDAEEMNFLKKYLGAEKDGNFHEIKGANILYIKDKNAFESTNDKLLSTVRKKIFEERSKRVRPHRDEKVLTDWNGLMIAAFAKAYAVFGEEKYLNAAEKAADYLLAVYKDKGMIMHSLSGDEWKGHGSLDDYSFLVWGLTELYEAGFNPYYLKTASDIAQGMFKKFGDDRSGGLYFTSGEAEKLIARTKELYDGAVPSGNSVALYDAVRLERLTDKSEFREEAEKLISAFGAEVSNNPMAYTHFLSGVLINREKPVKIIIASGDNDDILNELLQLNEAGYMPEKSVVLIKNDMSRRILEEAAVFIKDYSAQGEKTAYYVCKGYECSRPVTDIDEALRLLKE